MRISELARRAGVAPSAIRWYEQAGVLPAAPRRDNGYREYSDTDLARLRLVVALRRLGLGPDDAGRLAGLCLDHGEIDIELGPLLAEQRDAIARQRADLDRLEGELIDLEMTVVAAGRVRRKRAEPDRPISVLFVCTHNSARSQIAEALLRDFGGADFDVLSAGTEVTEVSPYALRVLADLGIDWSNARSKSITGPGSPAQTFLEKRRFNTQQVRHSACGIVSIEFIKAVGPDWSVPDVAPAELASGSPHLRPSGEAAVCAPCVR